MCCVHGYAPKGAGQLRGAQSARRASENWTGRYWTLQRRYPAGRPWQDLDNPACQIRLRGFIRDAEARIAVMRQPQDDLLIVLALVELARQHKRTPTEAYANDLAAEIANQHGLTTAEAIQQFEGRSGHQC